MSFSLDVVGLVFCHAFHASGFDCVAVLNRAYRKDAVNALTGSYNVIRRTEFDRSSKLFRDNGRL